ncbi:hypothetical protein SCH4B_4812 [Ruegeria sp. TrichCH4B]|nr:hypothetical protein SCH4B_4812 [Ruegeria sp. TrichCH4B]
MRGQDTKTEAEPGGYDRGAVHSGRGRDSKEQSGLVAC